MTKRPRPEPNITPCVHVPVVKLHGPIVVLPAELSREQYARAGDAIMRLRAAENHSHDAAIDAVWAAIKGDA